MIAKEAKTKYISPKELAERWSISTDTVYRMLSKGMMCSMIISGTTLTRIPLEDVVSYERNHTKTFAV